MATEQLKLEFAAVNNTGAAFDSIINDMNQMRQAAKGATAQIDKANESVRAQAGR